MSDALTHSQVQALERLLRGLAPVKIAVSGGVDSLTLAILAGRVLQGQAVMFHAVSPAVPTTATSRVQDIAAREHWALSLVDAGEFADEEYLKNPYVRCFHCKRNLYSTLARAVPGTVLSGTNLDDMGDFRPGLEAARRYSVRHPFVECQVDKASIRRICRYLGYPDISELSAAPCLSSRIQTGIRVEAGVLGFVDRVESILREVVRPAVVRCRVRQDEIAVELDPASLSRLSGDERHSWTERILAMAVRANLPREIRFESYRMGSAFVPDA